MTALTQPYCTLEAAPVEKLSEALWQVSVTLGEVHGTATHVVDTVMHTLGEVIHPLVVLAKRAAAVIFEATVTCHSGVTGRVTHLS